MLCCRRLVLSGIQIFFLLSFYPSRALFWLIYIFPFFLFTVPFAHNDEEKGEEEEEEMASLPDAMEEVLTVVSPSLDPPRSNSAASSRATT